MVEVREQCGATRDSSYDWKSTYDRELGVTTGSRFGDAFSSDHRPVPTKWLSTQVMAERTVNQAAEAHRQVDRIRPYMKWSEGRSEEEQERLRKSISSTIDLIYSFSARNLPIPTASVADENSSLFISQDGFYGDIELVEGRVEYFLKWKEKNGTQREVMDEEPVSEGRIPSKLLVYLFQKFAKYA